MKGGRRTYFAKMPLASLFYRSLKFQYNNPITPPSLTLFPLSLERIKDNTDLPTRCDV